MFSGPRIPSGFTSLGELAGAEKRALALESVQAQFKNSPLFSFLICTKKDGEVYLTELLGWDSIPLPLCSSKGESDVP